MLLLPSEEPDLPDGVQLLRGKLPRAVADRLYAALLHDVAWAQRPIIVFAREVLQPRLTAYMADTADLSYTYSRKTLQPAPWTEAARELRDCSSALTGSAFNSCLLNLYRDGRDSMAWHADNEPELGKQPTIASWSFGATRSFGFRAKSTGETRLFDVAHGDLLVMSGSCQEQWLHALPKRLRVTTPRLNLTYRLVRTQPEGAAPR